MSRRQARRFEEDAVKILFCTPAPITKSLGAAKVVVELAEEMRELGWECQLLCPTDLDEAEDVLVARRRFPEKLRQYLKERAGDYDVVDYDHEYLPYPRSEFSPTPLFVARSVLLVHHLEAIHIPHRRGVKSQIGGLIRGGTRKRERGERICRAQGTIENADLINVSNDDDKAELMRRGSPTDKIIVVPYGISRSRRLLFDRIPSDLPKQPVVAFVGTFDYRKGAREFPGIVRAVADTVPNVRFRFLGSKGLFRTEADIRSCFPNSVQENLEIILAYAPEELPHHLSACSLGIFPSYMEGFPFGVLEMMASSLPVIAYDAPGAPMMLKPEHLVERGDWQSLSRKVVALLQQGKKLAGERQWAKQESQQFSWEGAAKMTQSVYLREIKARCCPDLQSL